MTTIKQRIRMFAQWATAMNEIPAPQALQSVAQSDHKTWLITINGFQGSKNACQVQIIELSNHEYQITDLKHHVLWTGIPSDTNFNLAMQSALQRL